jgi:hypothetical protein
MAGAQAPLFETSSGPLRRCSAKYDHIYLQDYATPREARQLLCQFLQIHNERRLHEALGYRPPAEIYFAAPAA